jgi:MFS family permease
VGESLFADRHVIRVLSAFGIFSVVEFGIWGTLLLYAQERGGDSLMALFAVVQLLGAAAIVPVTGGLFERLQRGAALRWSYMLESALILLLGALLHLEASTWLIAAVGVLVTAAISTVRPLHYSVLPLISPTPRALVQANSISGGGEGAGLIIGFVISGVLHDRIGSANSAFVLGLSALIAGILTVGIDVAVQTTSDDTEGGAVWQSVVRVSRDPSLLSVLLLIGLTYLLTQALELVGISFASQVLGGRGLDQGLLAGVEGLGALLGSALAVTLVVRAKLAVPVCLGLIAASVPLLIMASIRALPPAVILLTFCGVGIAYSVVAGRTLLQRAVDDALLARVFSIQEGVILIGQALGAAVPILLLDRFGPSQSYLPLGVGLIAAALIAFPLVRGLDRRVTFSPDVVAALRRVPFLRALPPPGLERLAHGAVWVDVAVGTAVISQGEDGDAYYVVSQGRFSVTVDGQLREHTVGVGEGFGEIALLRQVPRTATITALEDSRVLRIERDDFLATVTGTQDGHRVAAEVASAHLDRDRILGK